MKDEIINPTRWYFAASFSDDILTHPSFASQREAKDFAWRYGYRYVIPTLGEDLITYSLRKDRTSC